jgi:lysophospholipase L1-like esterase
LQTITVPYVEGAKTIRISGYKSKVSATSDLWIKGNTFNDTYEHIYNLEDDVKALEANVPTTISQSKVLVMGDSISTDSYGNYKKWVTRLIESGSLPSDTTNSSRHATGFVARYNNEANDFITRIKAIENPSQYDLVVIFGGINDYIQNVPMGEETGTDYTVSFKPAVNEFFSYLIENFTQARICVLLPLRTKATWKNSVNEYEWSYSEYIHTVAKSYCFPVLNLTEESGFCPFISTFNQMWTLQPEGYTGHDGVHPNEEYERRFLAPMIKHFLQGMM